MLVEDAKKKICPFMTKIELHNVTKLPLDNSYMFCICGDCMAWIETKEYTDKKTITTKDTFTREWREKYEKENEPYKVIRANAEMYSVKVVVGIPKKEASGYCGMVQE